MGQSVKTSLGTTAVDVSLDTAVKSAAMVKDLSLLMVKEVRNAINCQTMDNYT